MQEIEVFITNTQFEAIAAGQKASARIRVSVPKEKIFGHLEFEVVIIFELKDNRKDEILSKLQTSLGTRLLTGDECAYLRELILKED